MIDRLTCDRAKQEELPPKPRPLPMLAPHLLAYAQKTGQKGQRVLSTLDISTQVQALEIIDRHHRKLAGEGILNTAAIILDVETGGIVAYVGNAGSCTGLRSTRPLIECSGSEDVSGFRSGPFLFFSQADGDAHTAQAGPALWEAGPRRQ